MSNVRNISHRPSVYGSRGTSDNQVLRATVHGATTLSSTAAGIIAVAIPLDPGSLTGNDFNDFTSTYDEFRVLGATINIISMLPNTVLQNNNIAAIAFDNDSSANPGSFTAVRQYNNSHVFSAIMTHNKGDPLSFTWWRPTSGGGATINWIDVAGTAPGSIQLYVDNLSLSTLYFAYAVELYIELRGRR